MIIVDLNQVMISNLYMQLGTHTNTQVEEPIFRHMVLNSLRSYKQKFGSDYGEMVIACDNKNYWRKQLFPYYKASRRKAQEKSDLNWTVIFEHLKKIKQELKDYFPYRVIDVESAEADDIIATLCIASNYNETVLILSADKDFIQLHHNQVKQYDPIRKRWMSHPDTAQFLKEHIIKGDTGDGIPNILSADNCLVIGERQKALTKKRWALLLETPVEEYDENVRRNYYRNKQLIDLSMIPAEIKTKIMDQYIEQQDKKRDKLFDYFMTHRLKNLMESISEF
jgi:hypothetical protein